MSGMLCLVCHKHVAYEANRMGDFFKSLSVKLVVTIAVTAFAQMAILNYMID